MRPAVTPLHHSSLAEMQLIMVALHAQCSWKPAGARDTTAYFTHASVSPRSHDSSAVVNRPYSPCGTMHLLPDSIFVPYASPHHPSGATGMTGPQRSERGPSDSSPRPHVCNGTNGCHLDRHLCSTHPCLESCVDCRNGCDMPLSGVLAFLQCCNQGGQEAGAAAVTPAQGEWHTTKQVTSRAPSTGVNWRLENEKV